MPLYEKKWWQKFFGKKKSRTAANMLQNIRAMLEELQDLQEDVKPLLKELRKLEELEKEREVATHSVLLVNLEAQAKILDGLLQRYELFQNDLDLNGLRMKEISSSLLQHAEKAGMKELVLEKKKRWTFAW